MVCQCLHTHTHLHNAHIHTDMHSSLASSAFFEGELHRRFRGERGAVRKTGWCINYSVILAHLIPRGIPEYLKCDSGENSHDPMQDWRWLDAASSARSFILHYVHTDSESPVPNDESLIGAHHNRWQVYLFRKNISETFEICCICKLSKQTCHSRSNCSRCNDCLELLREASKVNKIIFYVFSRKL